MTAATKAHQSAYLTLTKEAERARALLGYVTMGLLSEVEAWEPTQFSDVVIDLAKTARQWTAKAELAQEAYYASQEADRLRLAIAKLDTYRKSVAA